MSISVSKRVWTSSKQRGSLKLLMLAFADYANDVGICWPKIGTLADAIGEEDRYVRVLIKKLLASGEIIISKGGGRGNVTRYGVAVGLTPSQQATLNSALQNTVPENTVLETMHEETVFCSDVNSALQSPETVHYSFTDEVPASAPETPKPTQTQGGIHHGSVKDPSSGVEPRKKRALKSPQVTQAELTETPVAIHRQVTNVRSLNQAQRELIESTITDLDVWRTVCERFALKGWNARDMENMLDAYQKGLAEKKRAAAALAARRQPASYANGFNGYHAPTEPQLSIEEAALRAAEYAKPYDPFNERGKS